MLAMGAEYRQRSGCAAGPIAVLSFAAKLGAARPAMTAPHTGTIEGVAENAKNRPLSRVQLTLRAATGGIAKQATSRLDGRYSLASIAAGKYSSCAPSRMVMVVGNSRRRRQSKNR